MIDSFDRIRSANPAPRGTDLSSALVSTTALLTMIDERAATMPVETKPVQTRKTEKPTTTRRGWLTAAVAFGILLIIGTIFIILSRQGPEIPPAEESIAIWNEGDLSTFANLFQESAEFAGYAVPSSNIQRHFALSMALGEQRTGECLPQADTERVGCELTAVNDFGGPLGLIKPISWTFKLSDNGKITKLGSTEAPIDTAPPAQSRR